MNYNKQYVIQQILNDMIWHVYKHVNFMPV